MKIVSLLSGGLDSSTMLFDLLADGNDVHAVSFDYGQRHGKRELAAARTIAALARVPHKIVRIDPTLFAGTSLTGGGPVPHGHYEEGSMKQTVVPNRNMVMLALAASYAITIKADAVAYACHAGDHAIYPDCRSEFVVAMGAALSLCDWHKIQLITPYVSLTKRDIAVRAKQLGVPIAETWTCYEGGKHPCGVCGSCVERTEALA